MAKNSLVNSHNIQKSPPPFNYVPNNKLNHLTNIISILKQWYEVGIITPFKRGREEKDTRLKNIYSASKYSKDGTESQL